MGLKSACVRFRIRAKIVYTKAGSDLKFLKIRCKLNQKRAALYEQSPWMCPIYINRSQQNTIELLGLWPNHKKKKKQTNALFTEIWLFWLINFNFWPNSFIYLLIRIMTPNFKQPAVKKASNKFWGWCLSAFWLRTLRRGVLLCKRIRIDLR